MTNELADLAAFDHADRLREAAQRRLLEQALAGQVKRSGRRWLRRGSPNQ